MELVARYIFNILFGSILTFYMSLLLLMIIRLVIRSYRALYYLYLIPFMKVFYDLFFMDHSFWVFLHRKNVLNAIPNSRILSAYLEIKGKPFAGVRLHFIDGKTFSVGDVGAETIGVPLLAVGSSLVALLTLFSLARFIFRLYKALQWQRRLSLERIGPKLHSISATLKSPMLIGIWKSRIVIPKHLLETLSDKETQAIYHHERQHFLWKDNLLSIICDCISALFWFIPFRQIILRKASFYRELACDSKSEMEHLLGALQKTATLMSPIASLAFSSSDRITLAAPQENSRKGRIDSFLLYYPWGWGFHFCKPIPPLLKNFNLKYYIRSNWKIP